MNKRSISLIIIIAGIVSFAAILRLKEDDCVKLRDASSVCFSRYQELRKGSPDQFTEIIPNEIWGDYISSMSPIEVYLDVTNVVIALKRSDEVETGLYVHIPVSSYLGREGTHGFSFHHLTDGVSEYTRVLQPIAVR
ncbi:Unannotated [Lentimonas sp. CC19]|nr:Unannotated [Lentimonas sp. CC4]CAA6687477.1 Unannotated [Lentimonas sp. CC6]CAA6696589.1 Unannotated [Lentimonas sp. CC10]CAA6697061.1 Unannotated [Lentimonas sp. CC19]CAA7069118.1 Unannotated [Lentimonas sp. CC11]CAA7171194.1 Unannotated [Lentimonas sp. CC21]CAA7183520.1 Unannotated [Lentimonas sp. CC8]